MRIILRPAAAEDERQLWVWANDPDMRRFSFNPDRIPWTNHRRWFRKKLSSLESTRIFLAVDEQRRPVGQIRFDITARGRAEVDIYIAPEFRRKGLGKKLLKHGVREAISSLRILRIWAYVKEENLPSRAAFIGAGFNPVRTLRRGGSRTLLFTFSRLRRSRP